MAFSYFTLQHVLVYFVWLIDEQDLCTMNVSHAKYS